MQRRVWHVRQYACDNNYCTHSTKRCAWHGLRSAPSCLRKCQTLETIVLFVLLAMMLRKQPRH